MMLLHSVKERAIKVKGHAYGSRPGSTFYSSPSNTYFELAPWRLHSPYSFLNQMASFYSEINIESAEATLNAGLNQTRGP